MEISRLCLPPSSHPVESPLYFAAYNPLVYSLCVAPMGYMSRGISKDGGVFLGNSRLGWGAEALRLLSGSQWSSLWVRAW